MSNIISVSKECVESINVTIEPDGDTVKEKVSWFDKTNKQGDTNLKSLALASVVIYNFCSILGTLRKLSKQ